MIENTENEIRAVCNEIADMLIEKNRSYGDSALNPVRIFSKDASNIEQLNVRLDDKLSRLLRGNGNHFNEDVEKDLVGYLVLKRVAVRRIAVQKAVHVPAPPEYAQGQEAEKEEDDVNRTSTAPSAPTPGRFMKPTLTTAQQLLAQERAERNHPPGPANPPKPPYPREVA
jgi:hypothetical protein